MLWSTIIIPTSDKFFFHRNFHINNCFYSSFLTSNLTFYFLFSAKMLRNSNPKVQCSSCNKLIMKSKWADIRSFTQKDVHNAHSHFRAKQNFRNTLLLYMHRLWLSGKSFLVAAVPYPSLHIINFYITNETVTSVQLLAPTRKLTYLSMENLPLFIVYFKRFNTFCETRFLNCPERNFTTSK